MEDYLVCNPSIIPQEYIPLFQEGKKILNALNETSQLTLKIIESLEDNEVNAEQLNKYKYIYNKCNDQYTIIFDELKSQYDSLIREDEGMDIGM